MEPLLVMFGFISLALACGMSIVAWKLLRDRHDRSAARAEALHAMAFAMPAAADVPTPDIEDIDIREADDLLGRAEPPVAVRAARVSARISADDLALEMEPARDRDPEPWDLSLGAPNGRESVRRRPAPRETTPHLFDGNAPQSGAGARRWLALAAVALVLVAGVATTYALRTPEVTAAVAASRPAAPGLKPLELLSLQHRVETNGGFQVTGLVQNPASGALLRDVVAVVYLFDDQGNYFAMGRAMLNMGQVSPGDEAPFVVSFPNAVGVSRYRVGFRYDHGGVVAHIDHRAPGSSTTGASTDPPDTPTAVAAPRRSEG